jgi:hypothetical protein
MLNKEYICGFTDIGLTENLCKYLAISGKTNMPSEAEIDDPNYDEVTGEYDNTGLEFGLLRCRALERAIADTEDHRDSNIKVCEEQKRCSSFLTYQEYQTFLRNRE